MGDLLKDKKLLIALGVMLLLACIGCLSDVIATDGGLVPFGPDQVSVQALPHSSPGTVEVDIQGDQRQHFLGTDQLGRDVLSRLIHGISIAFKVGIFSSAISLIIAILLGGLSGYVGDRSYRISYVQLVLFIGVAIAIHYYAMEWSYYEDDRGVYSLSYGTYFLLLVVGITILTYLIKYVQILTNYSFYLPWDSIVIKVIEVFRSIPRLFLLLAIFAIISVPTVTSVVLVIGLIRWPGLTRIIRAEILSLKQDDYIKNAKILGLSDAIIFFRHVLPNIYRPIIVLTALNIGTAILIESSLSFLHIGLPIGEVSWGRMLSDARQYIPAWWLAIGPGMLIFLSILCFNTIGDRLSYHFKVNKQEL